MANVRKGWQRAGFVLLALAVICVAVPKAAAQVSKHYMSVYNQAVDEFNRAARTGDYSKAKTLFEKAIKINAKVSGPYRFLAKIGQVQKDYKSCLKRAIQFAKRKPQSKFIGTVRKLHEQCRQGLGYPAFTGAFTGRGAIHVMSRPDGAKVKLNGLALGATPLGPRSFSTGKVDVTLSREGYLPAKTTADVLEGFVTDVELELKEDPNAKKNGNGNNKQSGEDITTGWITLKVTPPGATVTIDGKPPQIGADGRVELSPGIHTVIAKAEGREHWGRRVRVAKGQVKALDISLRTTAARSAARKKGYLYLGGAAVFGALGVAFGILEGRAYEEASDFYTIETTRPTNVDISETTAIEPLRTRQDIADAKSRGDTYKLLQIGSLGVAAVALGVSIYYFVKERPLERDDAPLPVAITPLLPASGDIAGVGAQITYSRSLDW